MAIVSWKGTTGDWTNAADWSGGVAPGAGNTASFTGAGSYTVTLYSGVSVGGVVLNAANALLFDAGALTLAGSFTLQAGSFALAGALDGGTLVMAGGTLLAQGGTLDGVAVYGTLALTAAESTLNVSNGLTLDGGAGTGPGAIALTGQYSALNFLGSQMLANAVVTFGAAGAGPGQGGSATLGIAEAAGATSGATLTLASSLWLREAGGAGQIIIGGNGFSPYTDALANAGTITDAVANSVLTLSGPGDFVNQGTLAISNGATLDIACGGFTNAGAFSVSGATVDFGGTFATAMLGQLAGATLSAATVEIGGDDANAGSTLTIGSGTALGTLLLAGTITGGTVVDEGGGLVLTPGSGALDGVTYAGTLTPGAGGTVTLLDGTSVQAANVTGAGAALLLEGQDTLNNAVVQLGGSGGAELGTTDAWLAAQATTATLGPGLTITQAGASASLQADGTTPFPGFGLDDTLINDGSITAGYAGGNFTVSGAGTFINAGSIAVSNGDTLLIAPTLFANTGTLAVSGGAVAVLGGPQDVFGVAPAWSNTGVIAVSNATLELAGALSTAQIGSVSVHGGTLVLAGTLANSGATLTLGGAALPALTLTGTIAGGAIADAQGLLTITDADSAVLSGVTETGALNLTAPGAALRLQNGFALHGTATIAGPGAALDFQGNQSLTSGTLLLGASVDAAAIDTLAGTNGAASTLTLGAATSISQAGALADLGAAGDVAGSAIVALGTLSAATSGGVFAIEGGSFTNRGTLLVSNGDTLLLAGAGYTNTGTVTINGAALAIDESVTLAGLGNMTLTNASVSVGGTLNDVGGTLAIGAGAAFGRISLSGEIVGGTITDAGQGLAAAGGTLSAVTYRGLLDLSRPFQTLTIANGLALTDITGTQAGTIMLNGAASRLLASTSETIANASIYLGSAAGTYQGQRIAAAELAAEAGTTLTLAASTLLRSAGAVAQLGDTATGNWTDSIVNDGTVLEANFGGMLTVGASQFVNAGGFVVGNGGNACFAGVQFTNAGQISIAAGSALGFSLYSYYAAPDAGADIFSNSGTVRLLGGVIQENTGNGLFPAVPWVNTSTGEFLGFGQIVAPVVNNGLIESGFGPNLTINGAVSGAGTLSLMASAVLELNGAVGAGQTVAFTAGGETLRLDQPSNFAGTVTNFASGDALDITGTPVNTVAISNGTLVLGTGYGVFKLADTAPVGGEVSVGNDHHGGNLVTYTQQSAGSGQAVIAASQPKMLFWSSPVGDEFQGASANLNGAVIANWTGNDSLDFVDFLGTKTTVSYVQATGQGVITVVDGSESASVTLLGSYAASWFHVTSDSHGYAEITYAAH